MDNSCSLEIFKPPYLFYWLFFVLLFILSSFFTFRLFKWKRAGNTQVILISMLLIIMAIVPFIGTTLMFLGRGDLFVSYYPDRSISQMNAAIKNTCLLDPKKVNCPQNLEQVINLYPSEFKAIQENYALNYEYYSDTNNYTLVARPKDFTTFPFPLHGYIAIFDQRLVGSELSKGRDFINTPGYYCDGKSHLKSQPPFPGPWDKIN